MELVDENPDSDETMTQIAEDLLDRFSTGTQQGWVVLVGDGKTYEHLMNVKRQYGHTLKKLLIFPGDWHTLKHFQPVLMKVYFCAGLKELAKASGYRGSTLSSLETSGSFKRTHNFLLQAWEARYREMLQAFCTAATPNITDVFAAAKCILSTSIDENRSPQQVMKRISVLIQDSNIHANFLRFQEEQSECDDTWKFWVRFVMQDCYAYIGLYIAIRGSNWKLRISSLKQMAPLFSAFDRDTYQRLVPNHLADIQQYPPEILNCLEKGGFTVSITGKEWHSVALDEAHEMCINKDMKAAVVRPTKAYLQKTTLFFNYRILAYKNFIQQLFPERTDQEMPAARALLDKTTAGKNKEENIQTMSSEIAKYHLLPPQVATNRGLVNTFTGQKALPEQSTDLLSFRQVGTQAFEQYVTHRLLNLPSPINALVRRRKLLTMAPLKKNKKRVSQKEKELRQVAKCLRRRLAWCNQTKLPFDTTHEQYSVFPRALANEEGNPHKAAKSNW